MVYQPSITALTLLNLSVTLGTHSVLPGVPRARPHLHRGPSIAFNAYAATVHMRPGKMIFNDYRPYSEF